jgi:hypothetical protein
MQDAKNSNLKRWSSSHTLFEQVVVRKTAQSESILQGAKMILIGVR